MTSASTPPRKTPEIDLANRTMALCYAMTSVTSSWIIPLFDKDFERETSLQNRLFCLLACGLLDSGWEYRARISGLKNDAAKIGSKSCPYYLDLFSKYIALAVDLLEQIPPEDTIAMSELRNQWLHGNWTEIHKETRTVYYAKGGQIHREKILGAEVHRIMRERLPPDEHLTKLRLKFCKYRTLFWTVDRCLASHDLHQEMQADVMRHAAFDKPHVIIVIPDPTFRPDGRSDFKNLFEWGEYFRNQPTYWAGSDRTA